MKYDFLYYFGSIFRIFSKTSKRPFDEDETSSSRRAKSFPTQNQMEITIHLIFASKIVGKGLNFDHFEKYRNNIVHKEMSNG